MMNREFFKNKASLAEEAKSLRAGWVDKFIKRVMKESLENTEERYESRFTIGLGEIQEGVSADGEMNVSFTVRGETEDLEIEKTLRTDSDEYDMEPNDTLSPGLVIWSQVTDCCLTDPRKDSAPQDVYTYNPNL